MICDQKRCNRSASFFYELTGENKFLKLCLSCRNMTSYIGECVLLYMIPLSKEKFTNDKRVMAYYLLK